MHNLNKIELLKYSWSAVVRLNNGQECAIWYTAFHSMRNIIKEIISVSSDYPKHKINKELI
jgi:hypothetical protein